MTSENKPVTEGVDMALLAAVYALPAEVRAQQPFWDPSLTMEKYLLPEAWGLESGLSRVQELERARTIISAEINRLQTSEVQLELGTPAATSKEDRLHIKDSSTDCAEVVSYGFPTKKKGHDHRRKDGSIRRCNLAFTHLVGEGPPLAWCNHGKLDPDIGYCVHSGAAGAKGIRVGTPCDDPFNTRGG